MNQPLDFSEFIPDPDTDDPFAPEQRETYYCPWCGEEFQYAEELEAHEAECEAYFPWKGGK